jgi:hypothetical protein
MSDEDPPDEHPSEPPPSTGRRDPGRETRRSRLESVIPEILKRAVELGVEKARESPDNLRQFIHDMKLPKEVAHYLFQQVDDTKSGIIRVVAKEIREFLEHTNFSGEVQKLLTTVQFEVNTTIRFTPNDGRDPRKGEAADEGDEGEGGGEGDGARAEATDGAATSEGEEAPASRRSFPKPEVKTKVHVRRGDREAREAREARERRAKSKSSRGGA